MLDSRGKGMDVGHLLIVCNPQVFERLRKDNLVEYLLILFRFHGFIHSIIVTYIFFLIVLQHCLDFLDYYLME